MRFTKHCDAKAHPTGYLYQSYQKNTLEINFFKSFDHLFDNVEKVHKIRKLQKKQNLQ